MKRADTLMYVPAMSAFLNRWYSTYTEARAALDSEGGFLLPYKSQFLVTEAEAIRELGFDPNDPDWAAMGFEWVKPRDVQAHQRLMMKRLVRGA